MKELGFPLTLNTVLHRENLDHVAEVIALAERLRADRLELANTQYLGWALVNRAALLPTREQLERARGVAAEARRRLRGRMEVLFVTPDYYTDLPKACMDGWGRRFLVISPDGLVLPCHAAHTIARPLVREREGACPRGHLARFAGLRGVPGRGLDAGAVPELRAARGGLRRLSLPGVPPHRRRRRDRPRVPALARPRADRGGPCGGDRPRCTGDRAGRRRMALPEPTERARR